MSTATRSKAVMASALWLAAVGGAAYLAYRRYRDLEGVIPAGPRGAGGDFWFFLHGARQIAAGHSLYGSAGVPTGFYGYVYTPLIAVVLLPFAHAATAHVWHVWTALSIAALVMSGGLVTLIEAPRLSSWRRPLLFGFTALTILEFVTTKVELAQGQADAFVLASLAGAVLASERGRNLTSGGLVGLGGLMKTWPAAVALVVLRPGDRDRLRTVAGLVATVILGPVLAVAVGGASGLAGLVKTTFDTRSQHLISHSVWGTPLLLFSHSGLARPVLASTPLRDLATVILVAWGIGLLVATLRWSDSAVLCFWNVVGCVVLLLPVSHSYYTLYFLPILWIWAARWLATPRFGDPVWVVAALLGVWWLVVFHTNWSPVANGSATESSLRVSVVFFANLAAVTVSVLGGRCVSVRVLRDRRSPAVAAGLGLRP